MRELPRAILFDLDDTIISAYARPEQAWLHVVTELSGLLGPLPPAEVVSTIMAHASEYWSDAERARAGRMQLPEARRQIARQALRALTAGGPQLAGGVAERLADRFTAHRDEQMCLFPGACETLDALRRSGVALAVVTNGPSELQRGKLARFDLARRFDHVQIEGEHGFGKPDARAYLHAMQALSVTASDTWIVGDNLEWEVAAPQRLGIFAIWHDPEGRGLPSGSPVKPDRTIRSLTELLD